MTAGEQKTLPYELLAEHMAQEAIDNYIRMSGNNPNVLASKLGLLLQEAIHDGIETGLGLAGINQDDLASPSEVLGAYNAGFEAGKKEARNE